MFTTVDIYNQIQTLILKQAQGIATTTANTTLTSVSPDIGLQSSSTSVADIVSAISDILGAVIPPHIITGLQVVPTVPATNQVYVTAGTGTAGGTLVTLANNVYIQVTSNGTAGVYYLNLYSNGIKVEASTSSIALTIAKIVIPNPNSYFTINQYPNSSNDAYIVNYNEYKLTGINDQLSEDSIELLRDNIGQILADNIIGNLELSENLTITNTAGSLLINSNSVQILNGSGGLSAQFDENGTCFYNTCGQIMAAFTAYGACVGNIDILPNSIQSGNYVSGPMGSGFQICDNGNAWFNNISARGSFTTTVFQSANISAIGGSLLVINSDTLATNLPTGDNPLMTTCGSSSFAIGDILRMKTALNDEWFQVTACTPGTCMYTLCRDMAEHYPSGNGYPAWQKGTAIVDYGQCHSGGLYLTASDTNAPYMSVFCNAGSPWNGICTFARFGQLNGFLGYVSDSIGIAIGDCCCGYLTYDPVNGLCIKGNVTITGGSVAIKSFQQCTIPTACETGDIWFDTCTSQLYRAYCSGACTICSTAWVAQQSPICASVSSCGLYLGSDYMGYYSGSAWTAYISCLGTFAFCGTGNNYLTWDGANLCVRGTLNASDLCAGCILGLEIMTSALACCSIYMDTTCLAAYNASGHKTFWVDLLANPGSVILGDCTLGSYAMWNASACTFAINSYSANCCCYTCISGGHIQANSLTLCDPLGSSNASFLSTGTWWFCDPTGNCSPYVKRICSGVACTGATICLNGWCSSPNILVTANSLMAYNSSYSNQCQSWNLYADTPVWYCTCATVYGYCFGVHAKLILAAGTGAQCVDSSAFGVCICTNLNTCATCVAMNFQLWCNPACANYCYGTICYAICYRMLCCSPAGVWCACCFSYVQPHGTLGQMQTTTADCHNIAFPCSCQWQLMACCVSLTWTNSGITSGGTSTCTVSVSQCVPLCVLQSSVTCCIGGAGCVVSGCFCRPVSWTPAGCGAGWTLYSTVNGPSSTWSASLEACQCGGTHGLASYACTVFDTSKAFVPATGCLCCLVSGSGSDGVSCGTWTLCNNAGVGQCGTLYSCWCVCVSQCNRTTCYCCTYCTGSAGSCVLETLYGTTDTLSTACILDGGTGCVNWLATAYS